MHLYAQTTVHIFTTHIVHTVYMYMYNEHVHVCL